jgi:phage tail-like protein
MADKKGYSTLNENKLGLSYPALGHSIKAGDNIDNPKMQPLPFGSEPDPWGSYYFALEIDGTEIAHFQECSGLKSTSEVFEIQEGGFNGHVHKRPGRSKWDNIVLKYASNPSLALMEWRDKYLTDSYLPADASSFKASSGSIVQYANDGTELRRYNFVNAWPVGWEGPSLAAGGSELAIETLELAHEGIYVDHEPEPMPDPPDPDPPPERLDLPPVQFEYNSDELTPEGKEVCAEAVEQIEQLGIEDMWIEGHTCTMGSFEYNRSLSDKRAASVVKECKSQSSGNTRYYSKGFSWKYPVSSNATTSGKEGNRRSEFMTSSWTDRGWDDSPVQPESQKTGAPWNHR